MDMYESLEERTFLNLRCIFSKFTHLGLRCIKSIWMNAYGEEKQCSFLRCACMASALISFRPLEVVEFCTLHNRNKRKLVRRTWSLELGFEKIKSVSSRGVCLIFNAEQDSASGELLAIKSEVKNSKIAPRTMPYSAVWQGLLDLQTVNT